MSTTTRLPTFPYPIPPANRPLTDAERVELTAIVVAAYGPDIIERLTRAVWRTVLELIAEWRAEHDDGGDVMPIAA